MRLKDKVAIITGAGSGLGEACAMMFAKEGAKIVVNCRTRTSGEGVAGKIRGNGGEAIYVQADVTQAADCERMADESIKAYGKIDVLFNNAGINTSRTDVVDTPEKCWDEIIDTNLKGIFLCSKYVIPSMIKNGGGSIINNASAAGLVGVAVAGVSYNASKGGAVNMTKYMAIEYGRHNIRVNCICPGIVEIESKRDLIESWRGDEDEWAEIMRHYLLGRLGKPEDVGYAAIYLASDESSWVTGICLEVSGGYTAH